MRRGVALLLTITLVATIATLIGISSGILEHSFKRISNKQMLIQSNIFLSKFVEILNEASSQVGDALTLDIFLMAPLSFENKAHDLKVDIKFVSQARRPNINTLLESNATNAPTKEAFSDYFDQILTIYNISDKILLLSLIEDALDSDYEERISGSEIALNDPFFTQGHIYDMEHFEKILEYYKELSRDASVDAIPFEGLIGFKGDGIDINHIDKQTLLMLMPALTEENVAMYTTDRVDVYSDFEAFMLDQESLDRFKDMNVSFYSPLVRATMAISSGDDVKDVYFSYNLETKEVSDIEISNQR